MKILIVHLGSISQTLPATSVIKGIKNKIKKSHITWVIEKEENKYIFKYIKGIDKVISFKEIQKSNKVFDVLINLHPKFPHNKCYDLKIKNAFDYDFNDEFKSFVDILYGKESTVDFNVFQMYYKLSGLTWKGEGYNLGYFPKNKAKSKRVGIAVAHAGLRNYVADEINLDSMKIWYIPYKKNIFKRMDEINRCKKIITDDFLTLHLSLYLRKYVYFLQTMPSSTKIELFKSGEIYQVPNFVFD